MKKHIITAGIFTWWLLLGISYVWNLSVLEHHVQDLALDTAKAFFQQIVTTREWNARHGGVYVRTNETTTPNPYLTVSDRDLISTGGIELTLVNPSYMTRQISEIAALKNKTRFHLTSLNPIRPQNRAEPWEKEWLQSFEEGVPEQSAFTMTPLGRRFRYMAPLIVQESCLNCHRQQGYKLGDIRGGISVTLPTQTPGARTPLFVWHLFLALVGSGAFFFLGRRLLAAYEVIRHQAAHDALTGVPNRRSFTDRLIDEYRRSWRNHQPLSLIMCDIDDFKRFNDYYGHVEGDQCLMKVASALCETVSRSHDFCARYGGEEFVVILPNTDCNGARIVADRIMEKVKGLQIPHQASSVTQYVSITLGVSTDMNGMLRQEDLITQADKALYQAKGAGKNRVHYLCVNSPAQGAQTDDDVSVPDQFKKM